MLATGLSLTVAQIAQPPKNVRLVVLAQFCPLWPERRFW
jgi:hypothetical protein